MIPSIKALNVKMGFHAFNIAIAAVNDAMRRNEVEGQFEIAGIGIANAIYVVEATKIAKCILGHLGFKVKASVVVDKAGKMMRTQIGSARRRSVGASQVRLITYKPA